MKKFKGYFSGLQSVFPEVSFSRKGFLQGNNIINISFDHYDCSNNYFFNTYQIFFFVFFV
jgi:hypothetical protein